VIQFAPTLSVSFPSIKAIYLNVIKGDTGISSNRVYNPPDVSPSERIIGDSSEMMSVNIYLYLGTSTNYLEMICAVTLIDKV